jgi:Tfp pilus assembly protein PilP
LSLHHLHTANLLQKRGAAADLAAWEDQTRKQAAAELEQMEEDAKLQAEIDAEAKKLVS